MWVGAKAEIAAEILPRDWMKLGTSKNIKFLQKRIVDTLIRRADKNFQTNNWTDKAWLQAGLWRNMTIKHLTKNAEKKEISDQIQRKHHHFSGSLCGGGQRRTSYRQAA
jgi:hypothetical protein